MANLATRYASKAKAAGKKVGGLAKRYGQAMKVIGKGVAAIATEPFTGAILKKHNQAIDARNAENAEILRQRKQSMRERYPSK